MKTTVKRAIRDEQGKVLILVLILLVVGGLVLTPLLGLMSTGLVAGQVYEKKTDELYAADAGVEDAIWKIQNQEADFDEDGYYSYPDPEEGVAELWLINGKSVNVEMYREDLDPTPCGEELRYQILSTATGADGSNTTIDAYLSVQYMDFSSLLDYAIVSQNTITIQPNVSVNGSLWLPDEANLNLLPTGVPVDEVIDGEVDDIIGDNITVSWPAAVDLSDYYWEGVKHLDPYPDGYVLNIPSGTTHVIGPLLAAGDLTIKGAGWIGLDETIYVKGDLVLKATPGINLNLNGQTIFAGGRIDIPTGVSLSGSGCIIAVGNIDFQPGISSNPDDFVLVLSIGGTVTFQPNGDFTGCVAGNVDAYVSPDNPKGEFTLNWIDPEGQELDFPMGVGDIDELPPVTGMSILSWQIK